MNNRIPVKTFIFGFYLIFALILPVEAKEKNPVASALLTHGKELYAHGKIQQAFDDYSQALALDPYNKQVHELLIELSLEPHLTATQKADISLFDDLNVYLKDLEKKKIYFNEKISLLEKQIFDKGYDPRLLSEERYNIIKEAQQGEVNVPLEGSFDETQPLKLAIHSLSQDKEKLFNDTSVLKNYFERLRKINKTILMAEENVYRLAHAERGSNSFVPNGDGIQDLDQQAMINQEDDLSLLKKQLAIIYKKLNQLETASIEKDQKIERLTGQVIDLSLKTSEKDMAVVKQEQRLLSLTENFRDLQSRLQLNEEIMNEKEVKIQQLQETLAKIQNETAGAQEEFKNIVASKDEKLIELNGILQIYKGKLIETTRMTKQQKANMTTLEDQLDLVETRYFKKNKEFQTVKEGYLSLKQELLDIEKKISELKGSSTTMNEKPQNHQDEIKKLQSKLNDVKQALSVQLGEI